MKNVLVITYYFPPNIGAPAWRPLSWANHFKDYEISTTVICRHWKGDEKNWDDYIRSNHTPLQLKEYNNYRVFYLPSKHNKLCQFFSGNSVIARMFGGLFFFLMALIGKLNNEIDGALAFRNFIKEHLKSNHYDAVIITVPPFNMLQLVELFTKRNIKVIVDVRDLWNNMMLTDQYNPSIKQKFWDFIYSFHFKRWLKKVDHVTIITPPFKEVVAKFFNGPITTVYNGYEANLFSEIPKVKNSKFVFAVIGSIYPIQDSKIMIEGLKLFLRDKSPELVQLRFIGLDIIPTVSKLFENELKGDFYYSSNRVSKEEAIAETLNATVLSYPGWLGTKGIISTKIFDYIASGNPILIAPGDKDIIDDLLLQTKTGSSVFNAIEFANQLNVWYQKWLNGDNLLDEVNEEAVRFYSREHQSMRMADLINSL